MYARTGMSGTAYSTSGSAARRAATAFASLSLSGVSSRSTDMPPNIVKFANGFHTGIGSHVRHSNTNLMITPSADGAGGQVYLVLVDFATKPPSILTSASYSDELTKTVQGWRFKKRTTKGDTAPPAPSKP